MSNRVAASPEFHARSKVEVIEDGTTIAYNYIYISPRAEDAVQLIRNYYRWINQKKYQGAFNIWEKREDGYAANGQSFENFAGGFSDTASVNVAIGEPGEIEGAAGSNYIEIPVVISAHTKSGKAQKFTGAYTMRSSNIADDKSWYIFSAKVRNVE